MTKKLPVESKYIPIAQIVKLKLLPFSRYYISEQCLNNRFPHYRFGKRYFMTQQQIDSVIEASERKIVPQS